MNALLGILCFSSLFFRRFITDADWGIAGGGAKRQNSAPPPFQQAFFAPVNKAAEILLKELNQTIPCAIIASATLMNPAILAPITKLSL